MERVRVVGWRDTDCDLVEEFRVLDFTCFELFLEGSGNLELDKLASFLVCLAHEE